MSIDWSKPIYFPQGLPSNARLADVPRDRYQVLTTQRNHPSKRCVVFMSDTGALYTSTIDGQNVTIADDHKAYPVANIPETVKINVWINVFADGDHCTYRSKELADKSIFVDGRIACINVKRTVEVGEGLNK